MIRLWNSGQPEDQRHDDEGHWIQCHECQVHSFLINQSLDAVAAMFDVNEETTVGLVSGVVGHNDHSIDGVCGIAAFSNRCSTTSAVNRWKTSQ